MRHDKRKWHDAKSRLALSTSTNLLQFLTDATHRIFSYVQPFDHAQQNEIYKQVEDLEQKKVHLLMTKYEDHSTNREYSKNPRYSYPILVFMLCQQTCEQQKRTSLY